MFEYFTIRYQNGLDDFSRMISLDSDEDGDFVTWVDVIDQLMDFMSLCYGYPIKPTDYIKRKMDEMEEIEK